MIEVKSAFTAVMVVCLVMNMQEYVISPDFRGTLNSAHQIHSLVMSIVTLVCWVHRSTELYKYVFSVMSYRAKEAPSLNPPFHHEYTYANHHVLWNKQDLFFDEWKVRFGLWKCFRKPVEESTRRKTVADIRRKIKFDKTMTKVQERRKTTIFNPTRTRSFKSSISSLLKDRSKSV